MKAIIFFLDFILSLHSFSQKVFVPDTSINEKIYLLNSLSIKENLGDQQNNIVEDEGLPRVYFVNNINNTYLILYGQPGANQNKFAYFEIGFLSNLNGKLCAVYNGLFDTAKTESGIQLGISSETLFSIKGKSTNKQNINKQIKYSYLLDKSNAKEFLDRYNMPIYSAEYYFEKDRLVKFAFGFDYP